MILAEHQVSDVSSFRPDPVHRWGEAVIPYEVLKLRLTSEEGPPMMKFKKNFAPQNHQFSIEIIENV